MKSPLSSPRGKSLIVGLGNPGAKFEETRHNIGFIVVTEFARRHGLELKKDKKAHGWSARGDGFHLLLPATFMNESGRSVRIYSDWHGLDAEDVLVVTDDAELPFGSLRLRGKGSSGGHNGLKSIEQELGTREYARLRFGIGRGRAEELDHHVLGKFTRAEWEELEKPVASAVEALEKALVEPLEKVMTYVNRREKDE